MIPEPTTVESSRAVPSASATARFSSEISPILYSTHFDPLFQLRHERVEVSSERAGQPAYTNP
jgi:hypothetical protein